MSIRVALHHTTEYHYDRLVHLGPQVIRLRPAPHSRTPVHSYALNVEPSDHFINWQQDPHGNFLARLVFREPTRMFRVTVDLIAEMAVINPFDFFIEESATEFPFRYDPDLKKDLRPFLEQIETQETFDRYRKAVDVKPRKTIDFLVDLNRQLQQDIDYQIRLEPGVRTPDETLTLKSGSCRDSAWLLVQLLRSFGLAARFVSGYLIQLKPDQKSLDGPSGTEVDFTDLHAWSEVFLPGAGWVGLDPTSGLLTGEGHIPLAATPVPQTAAPISGGVEKSEVEFDFSMQVTRIHEDPRVTKPYTEDQWAAIDAAGKEVDRRLQAADVRLTMGGEPTFVSIDDMESAQWNTAAVGEMKMERSQVLIQRLAERFAPGALLHFGQGKWYPGESLPRWAYSCFWRSDGEPIWSNPDLLGNIAEPGKATTLEAGEFLVEFADRLGVDGEHIRPAYEDVWHTIKDEQKLPVDVDPREYDLDASEDRRRLAHIIERGVSQPRGYVLPLTKAWWQAQGTWRSGRWPFRSQRLFLLPGDSPIGLRLPLDSLPSGAVDSRTVYAIDPFDGRQPLPGYQQIRRAAQLARLNTDTSARIEEQQRLKERLGLVPELEPLDEVPPLTTSTVTDVICTAMCVELRDGKIHVFMPPTGRLEDYLELVAIAEETAESLQLPVVFEGYLPPHDPRIESIKVTPDPGVIEVNVHPAHDWEELKDITTGIYEEARLSRLGTEKFDLDGKHSGTGGGNHIVLGGPTPADSPFLRRPDLLKSLLAYWNNHPALSYLFSGNFIGPTSQAPRVDEGRRDALYELEIAMKQVPESGDFPPWLVDRIFRHLLVDLTGNTHRAEFCIDKLYSPDSASGRLGLVELRGFEMPPHSRMSLTQQLLVRALIAKFWQTPYRDPLIHWRTAIHDQFMLPHYLQCDLAEVLDDLRADGIPIGTDWFDAHVEFRCPCIGQCDVGDIHLEMRQAIEPWYVLGEEAAVGGTARYVDSSVERMQIKVSGLYSERYCIACNGVKVPLQPTDVVGEYVAGIRYRAWQPPSCLHPTIAVHTPLVFDVVDLAQQLSLGGCKYHVGHPGGNNPTTYPINALEAESRRATRFFNFGHTGGRIHPEVSSQSSDYPYTLDLRYASLR